MIETNGSTAQTGPDQSTQILNSVRTLKDSPLPLAGEAGERVEKPKKSLAN